MKPMRLESICNSCRRPTIHRAACHKIEHSARDHKVVAKIRWILRPTEQSEAAIEWNLLHGIEVGQLEEVKMKRRVRKGGPLNRAPPAPNPRLIAGSQALSAASSKSHRYHVYHLLDLLWQCFPHITLCARTLATLYTPRERDLHRITRTAQTKHMCKCLA